MSDAAGAALGPYVPRLLRSDRDVTPAELEGTFLSADISGFTRVSEQLEGFGREGAEIMCFRLDEQFGALVEAVEAHGGDVLFFGGDALFAYFTGPAHESWAAQGAVALQRSVRSSRALSIPGGAARLQMTVAVHTGRASFVTGGERQRSWFLIGPAVDRVLELGAVAAPGQTLTSEVTAAALDPRWIENRGGEIAITARPPVLAVVAAGGTAITWRRAVRGAGFAIAARRRRGAG